MSQFGLLGLTKEPGAVYRVDQSSFATYDQTYSGVLTGAIPFVQGEVPEEHPYVVLLSITVTETGDQCEHVRIQLHYEGKDLDFSDESLSQNISVDFTTSQEPIESHPDFVSTMGGAPGETKHGAFFDSTTGEFLGFAVVDPDEPTQLPSRFAGVRSYLMPQETYTSSTVDFDYPTPEEIETIGRVVDPGLPLPVLPGTRNWLNTGIRVQNIANVYYRTQRTGMLSGPRKWLVEAYGEI